MISLSICIVLTNSGSEVSVLSAVQVAEYIFWSPECVRRHCICTISITLKLLYHLLSPHHCIELTTRTPPFELYILRLRSLCESQALLSHSRNTGHLPFAPLPPVHPTAIPSDSKFLLLILI